MNLAIQELTAIKAVSKCRPIAGQFVSSIFLTNKPNGKKRFILNLKNLNAYILAPHFKMEDFRTASKLMRASCFMSTIDLKDAYFSVPIASKHRKYLRFEHGNTIYEFNCLPFGLCSAPHCFTKLMKPILEKIRSQGITCVNYLDDFLIFGDTFEECARNVNFTIKLITSVGLTINRDKSNFKPSKKQKFLGFIFNSQDLRLELPHDKRIAILRKVQNIGKKESCKIRELAKLIGLLVSVCPAVQYGWMYTKTLERTKYLALIKSHSNYNAEVLITKACKLDLTWWERNIENAYNKIRTDFFDMEIFTDASLTGWGACCQTQSTRGWWSDTDKKEHINILELKAIFYGLKCFTKQKQEINILIRTDNTTAVSYINRMGSIQHLKLDCLTREIWQWCENRKIWLFASYIPSADNWQADKESRITDSDTEWSLAFKYFEEIIKKFGPPQIDLFASNINNKCRRFISWKNDPEALAIDAFTVSWSKEFFYAFPPFSLILRTLRKIVSDNAEGIIVVPLWPSQAWYPLFLRLAKETFTIGPYTDLLSSPFSQTHPLAEQLTLVVAKCSGKQPN